MNSKIHQSSVKTDLNTFNHWAVPRTQGTVTRTRFTEYRPLSQLAVGSKIEFNIPVPPNEFINFSKSKLYIRMKISLAKSDASAITLPDWANITPANYMMHAMFSNIELHINNKETLLTPSTYPYRAHIEATCGYTADARSSHLTSALWYDDPAKRRAIIAPRGDSVTPTEGKVFELSGPLHIDYTFQPRPLPGGCEYKLVLYQNQPSFYLISNAAYIPSVKLEEVSFLVCQHEVSPMFLQEYYKMILQNEAKFPMPKMETRPFTLASNAQDFAIDNVCNGLLPGRMLVVLTDSDGYNGNPDKDPFDYGHFDLNFIAAYVNGIQYPQSAYKPNFDQDLYLQCYQGFTSALNQDNYDAICTLDREKYKDNPIFAFNFAPDLSNGVTSTGHVNLQEYGNLRLQLRFSSKLAKTINVICYLQYDRIIEIDKDRVAK